MNETLISLTVDVSVLENHHIAATFLAMQEQGYNVLEHLSKDEFKRARSVMIGGVLATDMSKHFSELGKFKARIGA
jgi:hypothetical protein